jgi:hypothetical protein|tara:strand:- start:44959 stop:45171 length:213 start_codon:yes stop_codon:yes gene_type:complete
MRESGADVAAGGGKHELLWVKTKNAQASLSGFQQPCRVVKPSETQLIWKKRRPRKGVIGGHTYDVWGHSF